MPPPEPAPDRLPHVHVFDPDRFPYAANTWYRPAGGETGTAAQLGHVLDAHGVHHALLVGPNSGYGLDNRCLLDALARGMGRYKGVAVVRNDARPLGTTPPSACLGLVRSAVVVRCVAETHLE